MKVGCIGEHKPRSNRMLKLQPSLLRLFLFKLLAFYVTTNSDKMFVANHPQLNSLIAINNNNYFI